MPIRKRRSPTDGDAADNVTLPLGQPLNQMMVSDEEILLERMPQSARNGHRNLSEPPQLPRSRGRHTEGRRTERPVMMTYSCLIIPMCFAAWWYWTKRKARRVIRLLRHETTEEGEEDDSPLDDDDFSTWEEVVENETHDPSVRFVRWINGGSARRRASVKQATKRTLGQMSCQGSLSKPFADEPPPDSPKSGWQCLEDAQGFELCTVDSTQSYDDLDRNDGESRTFTTTESYLSEPLWTP